MFMLHSMEKMGGRGCEWGVGRGDLALTTFEVGKGWSQLRHRSCMVQRQRMAPVRVSDVMKRV